MRLSGVTAGITLTINTHLKSTRQVMRKTLLLSTLFLSVTGCSTIPATSQLVLMAAGRKNNAVDATPASTLMPFNITCNNVDGNKLDFDDILSRVKTEAIKQKTGLSPAQIKQAATLLATGHFRSDIRGIVVMAISIIPNLANTLPQSGAAIRDELNDLKSNLEPGDLRNCMEAILRKEPCSDMNSRDDLFQRLYDDPSAKLQRETLVALLDNQSFRLALIVYAHSNGVDIDDADLDFVQNQLRKANIDIQALVDEGEDRLKQKYKVEEVKAKMDALTSSCK